jgi:hypothetical protein
MYAYLKLKLFVGAGHALVPDNLLKDAFVSDLVPQMVVDVGLVDVGFVSQLVVDVGLVDVGLVPQLVVDHFLVPQGMVHVGLAPQLVVDVGLVNHVLTAC